MQTASNSTEQPLQGPGRKLRFSNASKDNIIFKRKKERVHDWVHDHQEATFSGCSTTLWIESLSKKVQNKKMPT